MSAYLLDKKTIHGNTVVYVVTKLVKIIRKQYRSDVMIVLRCDAGFFDKVNFKAFDDLNIAFIATGKQYDEVKNYAKSTDKKFWNSIKKGAIRLIPKFCDSVLLIINKCYGFIILLQIS